MPTDSPLLLPDIRCLMGPVDRALALYWCEPEPKIRPKVEVGEVYRAPTGLPYRVVSVEDNLVKLYLILPDGTERKDIWEWTTALFGFKSLNPDLTEWTPPEPSEDTLEIEISGFLPPPLEPAVLEQPLEVQVFAAAAGCPNLDLKRTVQALCRGVQARNRAEVEIDLTNLHNLGLDPPNTPGCYLVRAAAALAVLVTLPPDPWTWCQEESVRYNLRALARNPGSW